MMKLTKTSLLLLMLFLLNACSHSNIPPVEFLDNKMEDEPASDKISPYLDSFTAQDEAIYGSKFLYIVSINRLAEAKSLIELGADINTPNPVDETPIEIAIKNNSTKMLALLLDYGARPNYFSNASCNAILATASGGDTRFYSMPLDLAYEKNNAQIIALLKQAGAKSASECFESEEAERKLLESLQPSY